MRDNKNKNEETVTPLARYPISYAAKFTPTDKKGSPMASRPVPNTCQTVETNWPPMHPCRPRAALETKAL